VKPNGSFQFRLYIAGDTQNSTQALANLTAICRARIPHRYKIEVVDLFKEPKRALADGVLMTPTLVILSPPPIRKIVGTLSEKEPLLQVLGVDVGAETVGA
jgi:circadian clock protein KaiB